MKTRLLAVTCFVALAALIAYAQTTPPGFEMATVVSIDKVPADARHPENANQYKIAMRMGDTIYNCHANGSPAVFIDWSPNKQFPAQVNGKVLQVKNKDGQMVDLNITGKKAAK
jgi:P pilus assembly chaperone PapD